MEINWMKSYLRKKGPGFGLEPLDHERDRHCAVFYVKPHGQAERLGSTYSFLHFKY